MAKRKKILVVADKSLGCLLSETLSKHNFNVSSETDPSIVFNMLKGDFFIEIVIFTIDRDIDLLMKYVKEVNQNRPDITSIITTSGLELFVKKEITNYEKFVILEVPYILDELVELTKSL